MITGSGSIDPHAAFYANLSCGNFSTYLKNMTPRAYYGISVNGTSFTVNPEMGFVGDNGITVVSYSTLDPAVYMSQAIEKKYYPSPREGFPLYVEECNCVLFATKEEILEAQNKYGSVDKLVKAYSAGTLKLINGSYTVISYLNDDEEFYTLTDRQILRIPKETTENTKLLAKKYGIAPETLEVNYVFIITTIVRQSETDKSLKNSTDISIVKMIPKDKVIPNEPIILYNYGFCIFHSREQAEAFIDTYHTVDGYMLDKALEATKDVHREEIDDINEQAKKDKKSMLEMFSIMGGTSIMSIVAENLIRTAIDSGDPNKPKQTSKNILINSLKIIGVGLVGVGITFGVYKLYQKMKEYNEDDDKKKKKKK